MYSLRFAALMKPLTRPDLFDPRTGQPDARTERLSEDFSLETPGKSPMNPKDPLVDFILKNTPDTIQIEFKRRPSPYNPSPDGDDLQAVISKDGQVKARQTFYRGTESEKDYATLETLDLIVKVAQNKPLPLLKSEPDGRVQPASETSRVVITLTKGTGAKDTRTQQLQEMFKAPVTGEIDGPAEKIARDFRWKTDLSEFVLEKHPGIAVNMKRLPWPENVQLMSNGQRDDLDERLFELSVSQNGTTQTRYFPNYPIFNFNLTRWAITLLTQVIALGNNTFNADTQKSPMDDYGTYADPWLKAMPVETP